jgi:hypothetical protein
MSIPGLSTVAASICLLAFCCTPAAIPADEAAPAKLPATLWGLRAGDRFVIQVFIVKQTEVTIDDQPPSISDTRDRFEIEYQVSETLKTGDLVFLAGLKKVTREAGAGAPTSLKSSSPAVRSLEELRLKLQVDPLGNITRIDPKEKEAMLAAMAALDPTAWQFLRESCPDEVIIEWFARPFWTAVDTTTDRGEKNADKPNYPERQAAIALGAFGVLKTTVTLQPDAGTGEENSITISGTGRFAPLVTPPSSQSASRLPLKDFTAELDEFSGRVRMSNATVEVAEESEPEAAPVPPLNRMFQSMETTARMHGTGLMQKLPTADFAKVSFQQTQIQLWVLTEQSFAESQLPFGIPGPVDPR